MQITQKTSGPVMRQQNDWRHIVSTQEIYRRKVNFCVNEHLFEIAKKDNMFKTHRGHREQK